MSTNTSSANGAADKNTSNSQDGPEFAIQRIYVQDISLESPNSPQIFQQTWQPHVDVQLHVHSDKLAEDVYEVKLAITITTKVEEKTAFLAEIKQAGIFTLAGFPEPQLQHMLGSYCPTVLFPFARELVAELVVRGGFPPLYLAPINFDALYEQQKKQATDAHTLDTTDETPLQ